MNLDDAFVHLPTFNTRRLRIRPMEDRDAEAIFAFKADLSVTERYGQEPHASLDATRQWVRARLARNGQRDSLFWVFEWREEAKVIGCCCFWNFEGESNGAELGYELHRAYWQKGIASEALPPVLAYGFKMGMGKIVAFPLAVNAPSRNLLLRLGFKYEGMLHERCYFRGRYLDQVRYSLLKEDLKPFRK